MALNGGLSLGFVFTARDVTGPAMRSVQRNFRQLDRGTNRTTGRMNRLQGSVGGVAMATGAAAASVAALGSSFKAALDAGRFEQELIRTNTALGGAEETLERIREKAFQSGLDTQFTPVESVQALKNLAEMGFSTSEAVGARDDALRLAAVGGFELDQMSELLGSSMRVFSADASEATMVANEMAKAASMSGINLGDMQMALASLGSAGTAAGFSREDQLSLVGLSKNVNARAQTSGRQAKLLMQAVAKNRTTIESLGVATKDAGGGVRDIQSIILDVVNAVESNSADGLDTLKQLEGIFGASNRTAVGVAAQLKKGIEGTDGVVRFGHEAIRQRNQEISNSAGFLKEAERKLLDTFAGEVDLLKGIIGGIAIELGTNIGTVFKPILKNLRETLRDVFEFVRNMSPEAKKMLSIVTVGGLALMTLVTGIGAVAATIGFVGPMITAGLSALGSALPWILGAAAAVGVLTAGFYALKKAFDTNLGGFGNTLRDKFNKVRLAIDGVFQLITKGKITGETAKALKNPENAPVLRFLNLVVKWGFRAKAFIESFVARVKQQWNTLEPNFRRLSGAIFKVTSKIDELIQKFTAGTPSVKKFSSQGIGAADTALGAFGATIDLISGYLETWEGWITGIEEAFTTLSIGDISDDVSMLQKELDKIFTLFGSDTGLGERSLMGKLGVMLGWLAGAGLAALHAASRLILNLATYSLRVINAVAEWYDYYVASFFDGRMRQRIIDWWDEVVDSFKRTWTELFDWMGTKFDQLILKGVNLARLVPEELRPDSFNRMLNRVETDTLASMDERSARQEAYRDSLPGGQLLSDSVIKAWQDQQAIYQQVGANDSAPGPVTEGMGALSDAVRKGMEMALDQKFPDKKKDGNQPVKVQTDVKLDGTLLGRAMYSINAKNQALGFGGDLTDEDE